MKENALAKISVCIAFECTLVEIVNEYYLSFMEQKTNVLQQIRQAFSSDWARGALPNMPSEWMGFVPTTMLAYECFKDGGLFARRPELEKEACTDIQGRLLCKAFHEKPWKYSFCRIVTRVQENYFEIIDILSGERFELYSRGVEKTIQDLDRSILFGILRFWNGHCWQTYSHLSYYTSFEDYDLLSFAKALDATCTDYADVYRVLDKNLLQFLALFCFAVASKTLHQKQNLGFFQTTCSCTELPLEALSKDFLITNVQGVYRLELKPYPNRMLVAEAFWAPKKKELIVETTTEKLAHKIVLAFQKHGLQIPLEPDFNMGMPMWVAIRSILQKELNTPLARRFAAPKESNESSEDSQAADRLMILLIDK